MVVITSYGIAIILCLITMLCWGSWANMQKLAKHNWPFQLFYWDYSIGIIILTLVFALTLGSIGHWGRSFFADLCQANFSSLLLAFASGVIFNLANILLVAAIDIAGMAVAFPIAIGLALVIGVLANYVAYPIGNAFLLFLGVILIIIAIIIDAFIYKRVGQLHTSTKGIIISVISGILMGYFYRFLAAAMSSNFLQPIPGKITPYSAAFIFSIGLFLSNFIFNSIVMAKPFVGSRVYYRDYFKNGNFATHLIGIVGGIIWSVGLSLNLIAAGPAGYAISYGLGQGATLIAALWGVFVWREFANAPKGTNKYIALMFIFYCVGLIVIILSRVE